MSRVGLVTTFRFVPFAPQDEEGHATLERCWSTLSSFLLFHLTKGVEHVFLYADADDGSNQVYIERIAKDFNASQVSVDVRDESQRERYQRKCHMWGELGSLSATEVPARQSLNAEDALRRAGEIGMDWLLHLDVDELFYTSKASIRPHFDRLNKLGVEQMTYANHEAVPSREDVGDYFREVDMFRVNHLLLPLSRAVSEGTHFWRRRTSHGQYMLAYDNGKAAVRVLPGRIVPQSVHRWRALRSGERGNPSSQDVEGAGGAHAISSLVGQEGADRTSESTTGSVGAAKGKRRSASQGSEEESGKASAPEDQLVNRVAMADPRQLRFDEVLECVDPCVLHYPSCGLDWLRDKYSLLGSFPSSWFGGNLPIAPCFHLDARNAIHEEGGASSLDGAGGIKGVEEDGSRDLYRKEVMLCPDEYADEIRAQLKHGVLRIIAGPLSVIEHARNSRGPPGSSVIMADAMLVSTAEGAQSSTTARGGHAREQTVTPPPPPPSAAAAAVESETPAVSLSTGVPSGGHALPGGLEGGALQDLAASSGFDSSWIIAACAREFL